MTKRKSCALNAVGCLGAEDERPDQSCKGRNGTDGLQDEPGDALRRALANHRKALNHQRRYQRRQQGDVEAFWPWIPGRFRVRLPKSSDGLRL